MSERDLVREPVTGDGWQVSVDVSIGVVRIDDPTADPALLIDLADQAMYEQKRGRTR